MLKSYLRFKVILIICIVLSPSFIFARTPVGWYKSARKAQIDYDEYIVEENKVFIKDYYYDWNTKIEVDQWMRELIDLDWSTFVLLNQEYWFIKDWNWIYIQETSFSIDFDINKINFSNINKL